MRRRAALLFAVSWALSACGASTPRSTSLPEAALQEDEPPRTPPVTEGTIVRGELDQVLAQGLGRFLQVVTTEPHLDGGRFVGHRLTELRGPFFRGVDLRPGDTLVRINGMAIERPEQALAAWNALRVASELTVEYVRDGARRELRFAIEE